MKSFLTILFIIQIINISAQNDVQTKYLVTYGQVWGVLKYFHPMPSEMNWDQVLLDDFQSVKECKNETAFNEIIATLIHKCGDFEYQKRNIPDSLKFKESFEWMNNEWLSASNKNAINNLIENKPNFENHYIKGTLVGNPKISNEIEYGEYKYNPAVQYLAITRYWNIINYYCPNRTIIPENWTKVYYNNLQGFVTAETYEVYYFEVRKLTTKIRDAHGFIRTKNNPTSMYKYAPFYCTNVSDGYFITHVWQDSLQSINLNKMDKVISINGVEVEDAITEIGTYLSTSNDYYLSKSTHYLRVTQDNSMIITVERNGEVISDTLITLNREEFGKRLKKNQYKDVSPPYKFLTDSISGKKYGYINMAKLERKDINWNFKRKLKKVNYLIIDSRNYPNWTVLKLSKVLLKNETTFAKFIKMDFDYPGSYKWTKSQTIGGGRKGYEGKIYVLVDYMTMSQAEYTVMAFQQHTDTKVIGGQTAGADGNISEIPLPYGIKSIFSGLGVFYPDGKPTQQVGVYRDYSVVQDKSFLIEKKDLILEKALELIRKTDQ